MQTLSRKFPYKAPLHMRSAKGQQKYLWFAAIHAAGLILALLAIAR